MTQKSYADQVSDVSSTLPDNTAGLITPAVMRERFNNLLDSIPHMKELFVGDNTGATNVSTAIQAKLEETGGVCILPAGTYLLTSQITKPTSGTKFVLKALGNGPVIIKHNIGNKAIFIDNSGLASSSVSVSAITRVTDNTNDYVNELAVASLPTGASRGKYCAVYCQNFHLGEKTYMITNITKANPAVVTTGRAHGLSNGNTVYIAYAAGMTEVNDLAFTVANKTATTFELSGINSSGYGVYTANSGFAINSSDYGFLGEGAQIMETEATKIRLYGCLKYDTRMTSGIKVRVVDDTYKVHIEGIEFQPNGDPYASTTRTVFDCVEIIACVGGVLKDLTFKNSWSIGLRLRSCMNFDIDNLNFEGAMNKITSTIAFGYGLAQYGMNYAHKIGRMQSKQLRHMSTTGTSQGSAFSDTTWYNHGYMRKVSIDNLTAYNATGTIFDTHEPCADLHIKNATLIGGFNGPEDDSSVGGAVSDRAVDTVIDNLTIIGCRTGLYIQLSPDHGIRNTLTIGTFNMQGHPQSDDTDVAIRIYDQGGCSYPARIRVGTMIVKDVGRAMQIGTMAVMEVGNIQTSGVDVVALAAAGSTIIVWGNQFYDFTDNPFNQPAHSCYLMYSDATYNGCKVLLMTTPTIYKGEATRPTQLFTEQDTTATKYYYVPDGGINEINPGGYTKTLLLEAGQTTLVRDPTVYQLANGVTKTLSIGTTAVGNITTGEDNLMTYTLPAVSLFAAGKGIRIRAWGTGANNANVKTIKFYFGSATIYTATLTQSQANKWEFIAEVVSTGTDTQDYIIKFQQWGTVAQNDVTISTATQDDGADIVIKLTGEGTSTNDIVQEGMRVEFT